MKVIEEILIFHTICSVSFGERLVWLIYALRFVTSNFRSYYDGTIAIGFAFVMVFYKSGSLIPCIITHSLVDITSKF